MISMTEYAKRREQLMHKVGRSGIVILPSATEVLRNGDAYYPFRQNSDFYYLTGFDEPEAVLVLLPERKEGEYLLFCRERDKDREIWDGPRAGLEGAQKDFGVDKAFPISKFEEMLPELLVGKEAVHFPFGIHPQVDEVLLRAINKVRAKIRSGLQSPIAFMDITPSIHEMRLFKSEAEIAVMQKAVDITADAHVNAMKICKPGLYEYDLDAEIFYTFVQNNAVPAYGSIVGSGANTCVLHYVKNNKKIAEHDLVLIDAGAEFQNYAADITRTFPANGKFSAEQRAIYELVLTSQEKAIEAIKPGLVWTAMQDIIVKVITQGLIDLGILKGNLDDLIEKQAYFPFYMHRSGHWLGIDVHDAGRYNIDNQWRLLEPGMVFTVEPGIYISQDIPGVDKRWHNIGVRIEDDILVTENANKNLSQRIPKTIADIEAIMVK